MSEVDRLSHSGLYPALPIADKGGRERRPGPPADRRRNADTDGQRDSSPESARRPPKSIIDDYA